MVRAAVVFLLTLGLPAAAAAEMVPLTDQTVLADTSNLFEDFIILSSAKTVHRGGEFMVSWTESHSHYFSSQLIGWTAGISARKIGADGGPAPVELTLVPQSPQLDIYGTDLAADPSGGYAVVWNRVPEGRQAAVWLRRFSPADEPVATVLLDHFRLTAFMASPTLALPEPGRPFAVWGRPQPSAPAQPGLFAQLFLPSGLRLPRFQVTARARSQDSPTLGADGRGQLVLVYTNHRRPETSELFLRTYDRDGRPTSAEVRLAPPFAQQHNPALAVHADGRFVVAWQEDRDQRIWAQIFAPPYRPLGPPFPVSSGGAPGLLYRDFPAVAVDAQGRFVIVWRENLDGQPHVQARAFAPQGTPLGEAFQVDQRPEENVFNAGMAPSVAAGEDDTFLIAWTGPEEETGSHAYSRLYALREPGAGS